MDQFKRQFQQVDALLIDDIQFFAGKDRTQEEFFHTFNALFDGKQQIILTCDRYPREVESLEPRLKSRLGWGLSVAIEPPDFETRAAILLAKAHERGVALPEDVAYLIAKRMRSNVRDLEGALNTLAARANFMGRPITPEFAQETLRDLLRAQQQAIGIPNIQKTVADYYGLRITDMLSKRRTRSLARPRQMAMALAKELTEHSLPEIGDAFGGRDHTTVLHACRLIRDADGDRRQAARGLGQAGAQAERVRMTRKAHRVKRCGSGISWGQAVDKSAAGSDGKVIHSLSPPPGSQYPAGFQCQNTL